MNRFLNDANSELRRVDHLIHVSLKYTRTVDIIKSIIERLINAYDFCIIGILDMLVQQEKVEKIPTSPGLRAKILTDNIKDEDFVDFINFYHLLRNLKRADFQRSNEFRRHVKMTAMLQDGPIDINIDVITEYYQRSRVFLKLVQKLIDNPEQPIKDLLKSAMAEVEFEARWKKQNLVLKSILDTGKRGIQVIVNSLLDWFTGQYS